MPLQQAGLAAVAMATLLTCLLAVPTARLAWQPHARASRFTQDALRLWGLLALGALIGPHLTPQPSLVWIAVLAGIGGLSVAVTLRPGVRLPLFVIALLSVVVSLPQGDEAGLVLLEPGWRHLRDWLPITASWAALLAGAGVGLWSRLPPSAPGRRRLFALPAGIALLGLIAQAVVVARSWGERGELAALPWPSELLIFTAATAVFFAPAAPVSSPPTSRPRPPSLRDRLEPIDWRRTLTAAAAVLWFAGPAADAANTWWSSVFLLGPALLCASSATRQQGSARFTSSALALAWIALALLGWPGLPEHALAAAALAALPVVVLWTAGTRAVMKAA